MKLVILAGSIAGLFLVLQGVASSAEPDLFLDSSGDHVGNYLCVPEISGGLRFDPVAKKWVHGSFNVNGKSFLISVGAAGERRQRFSDTEYFYSLYEISLKDMGDTEGRACFHRTSTGFRPEETASPIGVNGYISCTTGIEMHEINFSELRFMNVYPRGYVDGKDQEGNTPAITVGQCVKLD